MITIKNENKYLTSELIQPMFHQGEHKTVNKVLTGNGFTTAFSNLEIERGCVDIIILPNKKAIQSKEESYKIACEKAEKSNTRIEKYSAFIYGGSDYTDVDFISADILYFVSDSFLLSIGKINKLEGKRVRNICLDEIHSTQSQSSFRDILEGFEGKVDRLYPNSAIVSVTATPLRYLDVDYVIENTHIIPQTINVTNNAEETIDRIKALQKKGDRVIVFSNNKSIFTQLKNRKNILNGHLIFGSSLALNLSESATMGHDNESKSIMSSSRGHEGFDVKDGFMEDKDGNFILDDNGNKISDPNKKWSVFFFEDRSNEHERFLPSNLYQALSRTRDVAKSIEYCRFENSNPTFGLTVNNIDSKVEKFISNTNISSNAKMSKSRSKNRNANLIPFVSFNFNTETKGYDVIPNEVSIAVFKEKMDYDKMNFHIEFEEFFNDRGITFADNREAPVKPKSNRRQDDKFIIKTLLSNTKYIDDNELVPFDYQVNSYVNIDRNNRDVKGISKGFLKALNSFLIRKNHNGLYVVTERQNKAMELLSVKGLSKLSSKMIKMRKASRKEKLDYTANREFLKNFNKETFIHNIAQVVLMFSNDTISVGKNLTAHRDYNLLTKVGMSQVEYIAALFNVEVDEFDIVSCNPRILYALCGKHLPANFYGVDKVNKQAINSSLNRLILNTKISKEYKDQKSDNKKALIDLGIDREVAQFLVDSFTDGYKDDLFNLMSYYEGLIIKEAMEYVREYYGSDGVDNDGVIRRHDSFIVFNNGNAIDLCNWTPSIFPNIKGWFDRCEEALEIEIEDVEILVEEFPKVSSLAQRLITEAIQIRDSKVVEVENAFDRLMNKTGNIYGQDWTKKSPLKSRKMKNGEIKGLLNPMMA